MPRGGKREGAGRTKGSPNKATQERQAKVAATGITPLDLMLENMRHAHAEATAAEALLSEDNLAELLASDKPFAALMAEVKKAANMRAFAQECAKDAAPYVHPRLQAVELTGKNGGPVEIAEASDQDRARALAAFVAKTKAKAG